MGVLTGVSLIAAFFAGVVALFAPCCITFLLPSYLGQIFKNKEKVVLMTLIFGLGIATILVPVALGIGLIGQIFGAFHTQTYILGGLFMILLGILLLLGKKFTLPMVNLTVDLNKKNDPWSVYLLGIFSGITSSCCAPVLAGVMAISFLSPSLLWAFFAGIFYVVGMISPLIILAFFLEKVNWSRLPLIRSKTVPFLGRKILLTDFVAGVIFLTVGVIFIYLSITGKIVMESTSFVQGTLGLESFGFVKTLRNLGLEPIFALVVLAVLGFLIYKEWKKSSKELSK